MPKFVDISGSKWIVWSYPEIYDREKQNWLSIDLSHTRASDGIRIKYDSERDGWVIEQPKRLSWFADEEDQSCHWTEVAFVESWAINEDRECSCGRPLKEGEDKCLLCSKEHP